METNAIDLLPFLSSISQTFQKYTGYVHRKLDNYITQGSDSDNLKLKKQGLLYYIYTSVFYSVCLPIFNPYASYKTALVHVLLALFQIFLVRVKNYSILVCYFAAYTFLSIYLPVVQEEDCLKAIGQALMHHNLFFLFPDSLIMKISYIFISLGILRFTQFNPLCIANDAGYDALQGTIANFYYTWPLIYIVNHLSSMNLVSAYQKSMRLNKIIEDQFKEANKKLSETNEKLTKTLLLLEKTNRDLNDALKGRELFIASASHELRNPLNAMIGNIELVRLELKDPKLISMLDTCKICGEVLLALINNVLDVTKINAEKLELHYVPDNFLRLLEKVWNISTLKIKQKNIKGELIVAHNFPKYIEMDPHRFMQILLNIIGNSTKFTTQGFVKVFVAWHECDEWENLKRPHDDYLKLVQRTFNISCDNDKKSTSSKSRSGGLESMIFELTDDDRINLHDESVFRTLHPKFFPYILASKCSHVMSEGFQLHRDKSWNKSKQRRLGLIKIDVVDTGCGIPAKNLPHLFQPFYQGDSSVFHKFGGTGLGLYITEQLILKMGGQINVYSQEGVGSNFSLLIPTTTTTKEEMRVNQYKTEGEIGNGHGHGKPRLCTEDMRALVVDEDPINRSIFCGYLKRFDVAVDHVHSGQEALNKLKENGLKYYSFISMDIEMPLMNGYELSREIRNMEAQSGSRRQLPIIIITGNCTEEERLKSMDPLGSVRATCFYRKPFTYKDCKLAIKMLLNASRKNEAQDDFRVLIVDDDPFNVSIAERFFTKNGFVCDPCSNGKDAVDKVMVEKYNAVLMDCEMPEMDGFAATRLIKQKHPEMLVVGATGHSDEQSHAKGRRSGMSIVETKPLNFEKISKLFLNDMRGVVY